MIRYRTKPDCGTRSGYDYHVRQVDEAPCTQCREAEAAYWRAQRATRNEAINAKRRARAALRREKNTVSSTKWWTRKDEIVSLYGAECYLGEKCYLGGTPIDFEASRKVGALGWEYSFHPDHVVPLSKGGEDVLENIRPAHAYCNQRKWAS